MLMFAGGLPSPDYFPFESISAQALVPNSFKTSESSWRWLMSLFTSDQVKTSRLEIPKYVSDPKPDSLQLSTALQYGQSQGTMCELWLVVY
jgi:aromatic amino acid aminotransferase I